MTSLCVLLSSMLLGNAYSASTTTAVTTNGTTTTTDYCRAANVATCSSAPDKCPAACLDTDGKATPDLDCLKACLPWQKCFGNFVDPGCQENSLACQPLLSIKPGDQAKIDVAKAACVMGQYSSDACLQACLAGLQCVFGFISGLESTNPLCPEWENVCTPVLPVLEPCVACEPGVTADFPCLTACVPYIHCVGKGCTNTKSTSCDVLKNIKVSTSKTKFAKAQNACKSDPSGALCVQACLPGIKCVIDSFAGANETGDCAGWLAACKGTYPTTSSCPAADVLNHCSSPVAGKCPAACLDTDGKATADLDCLKACLPWQKCFGNVVAAGCQDNSLACQPLLGIETGDQAKIDAAKAVCVAGQYDSDACLQACLPGLKCVFGVISGLESADALCPEWEKACTPVLPVLEPCVACDLTQPADFPCLTACVPYIHCVGKGCVNTKAAACDLLKNLKVSTSKTKLAKAQNACKSDPSGALCVKACLPGIKCVIDSLAGSKLPTECAEWVTACEGTFTLVTTTMTTSSTTKVTTAKPTTTMTTSSTTTTAKPTTAKVTTAKVISEVTTTSGATTKVSVFGFLFLVTLVIA